MMRALLLLGEKPVTLRLQEFILAQERLEHGLGRGGRRGGG